MHNISVYFTISQTSCHSLKFQVITVYIFSFLQYFSLRISQFPIIQFLPISLFISLSSSLFWSFPISITSPLTLTSISILICNSLQFSLSLSVHPSYFSNLQVSPSISYRFIAIFPSISHFLFLPVSLPTNFPVFSPVSPSIKSSCLSHPLSASPASRGPPNCPQTAAFHPAIILNNVA